MPLLEALRLKPTAAMLRANPALATSSAPLPASGAGVDAREAAKTVADRNKEAIAYAASLKDRDRKVALAQALAEIDTQRQAAARLVDPAAQVTAYKQILSRLEVAMNVAKRPAAAGSAAAPAAPAPSAPAAPAPSAPADDKAAARGASSQAGPADAKAPGAPSAPTRAELAKGIRPAIVEAEAAERRRRAEVSAALERCKAAAGTKGPQQEEARKREAALEADLKGIDARLKQFDADLKAVDSPSTSDAALHAVVARHQRPGKADARVVRSDDTYGDGSDLRAHRKTTTTTLAGGQAHTREDESSARLDEKGLSVKQATTVTTTRGDSSFTQTRGSSATLDGDGLKVERSTKREFDDAGIKSSDERKTTLKVDSKSATLGKTTSVDHADGSSTERSRSAGVESGDGKAAVVLKGGSTREGKDESKSTRDVTAKGGISSGKDGIGAFGQVEGNLEKTTGKGFKGGIVPGLSPNIVCNVVPRDGEPPLYDVFLKVELGVSVTVKGGYDKDPGKDSSGKPRPDDNARVTGEVSGSASHKVTMEIKHQLQGAQLDAYLKALKTGDGTDKEFAVIKAGLSGKWDVARDLWLAMSGQAMDVSEAAKLKAGESRKTGSETTLGAKGGAGVKGGGIGVSVEGGYEQTSAESSSVTMGADGKLVYARDQSDTGKTSGGAKVKAGVAEGGVSIGKAKTTSTGYEIVIDPNGKYPDNKTAADLQKEFAACKSQAQLDAFAAKYGAAVVKSKTKGTADADTLEVSAGLGEAAKGKVNFGKGVAKSRKTDAQGNLIEDTVTGSSDSGAEITVLGKKMGASSKVQMKATTDGQGHVGGELSKTDTEADTAKWLAANVPFSGGPDKADEQGAIAKRTGAAPDTDKTMVTVIKLGEQDYANLALLAVENWKGWMDSCVSPDDDDRKGWVSVGRRIQKAAEKQRAAVAARELAEYIGKGIRERNRTVESALGRRTAGRVGAGTGAQFPGGLSKWKDTYLRLVTTPVPELVEAAKAAAKDGPPGLEEQKQLEQMHQAFEKSPDFESPALRAEMLRAVVSRQTELRAALRTLTAGPPGANDAVNEKKERYNALLKNCISNQADEQKAFAKIDALIKDGGHHAKEITQLVNELKTMYASWDEDYGEMARLAEANKFGSGSYWAYRPDRKRLELAAAFKAPGLASQVAKAQAPRSQADIDAENRKADEQAKVNNQRIQEGVKSAQAIERQLPGARASAMALSNKLEPLVKDMKKPAAAKLYNQAYDLFTRAEGNAARIRPHFMEDLNKLGPQVLQDYQAAAAALTKALAMFPNA